MELIKEYLVDEALMLIPVLLVLGKIIKNTPNIKDWLIPYILLVVGTVFTVAFMGFSPDAFVQGILVSGAAVFGNQLYKQAKEGDDY